MKKINNRTVAGACIMLLLLITACEQMADPDPQRVGWAYYPLSLGQYRIYDVYRINYNFTSVNDTLEYELKERVRDFYINQSNDTVYVLERLRRYATDQAWQLDSAYAVQRTQRWLMVNANNRPQLTLKFPVSEGLKWNANLLNASPSDTFMIESVGKPFSAGNITYDHALRVVQEDIQDTIVETDEREEVYALQQGLVYKRTNNLKYCTIDENCRGRNIITTGLFLVMNLKESGIENP